MLLTVSDTVENVEFLRYKFSCLHFFTYCTLAQDMLDAARLHLPDTIFIKMNVLTDKVKEDLLEIRKIIPKLTVILLYDGELSPDWPVDLHLEESTPIFHIVFHTIYYAPVSPNGTEMLEANLLVHGMLFNVFYQRIYIYGDNVRFSTAEAFLLRYLAEIFPRRADVRELAAYCFPFGTRVSNENVYTLISRINARVARAHPEMGRPVITHKHDEGYQIDF